VLFPKPIAVLEPMCGYAEGLSILRDRVPVPISYEGFDYSENLIAKVKAQDPSLNVRVAEVTSFKSDGKFDLVILIGGLHHVFRHTEEVVRNLSSVLVDGGHFINLEPTHNNPIARLAREMIYKRSKFFDENTERGFDLVELDEVFLTAGFEKADQIYPGLLSHILYYNPDAFPWLNAGGEGLVRFLFGMEKRFYRSWVARKLSFATLTLWRKRTA